MKNLITYLVLLLICLILSGTVNTQKRKNNKNKSKEKPRRQDSPKKPRNTGQGCSFDDQCKSKECIDNKCK